MNSILLNNFVHVLTLSFGKLTAVQHANGRDWWIVVFKYFSNIYHRLLLHPGGISEYPLEAVGEAIPSGVGQAVFSPDGTKYAKLNIYKIAQDQYLDIYDFDRCTGLLSNPVHLTYRDTAFHGGIAFSPNSRYLYLSSDHYLYQYDMWAPDLAASRITIDILPVFPAPSEGDFALIQLAPDQKIYVSGYNRRELHVIHNPNAAGLACNFERNIFSFTHILGRSIPNHPYYGLGPWDGSPCDTLGIDHHPQAAFQHAEQELEATFWDYSLFFPTQWQWDFGDGSSGSAKQNPVHSYTEPGLYEVCLTVSNENASDTHCEWVEVMVTPTQEVEGVESSVKVLPNPAGDYVSVIHSFDQPTQLILCDAYGKSIKTMALSGFGQANYISTAELTPGLYIISLVTDHGDRTNVRLLVVK